MKVIIEVTREEAARFQYTKREFVRKVLQEEIDKLEPLRNGDSPVVNSNVQINFIDQ